jgi:hypothetical protein
MKQLLSNIVYQMHKTVTPERGGTNEVSPSLTFLGHSSGTLGDLNKFTDLRRQSWECKETN